MAATCGECVTTSTWPPCARSCSLRPTAAAVAPPTPRSISSKIIVSPGVWPVRQTFSARRKRDNSPPEAMRFSGPGGVPGLVATVKVTPSLPSGPESPAATSVAKTARSILRGASSPAIAASSRSAAARRDSPIRAATAR